jgi:cysteinyl-tRNA synthetase
MVYYQGAKMSKSIGNLIMVRDLLKKWSSNALRLYLGSHHYRDTWSYNEDDLKWAEDLACEVHLALSAESGSGAILDGQDFWITFKQFMDNDLNTPGALQTITDLTKAILAASKRRDKVLQAQDTLKTMVKIFGYQYPPGQLDPRVIEGWERHLIRFV